jgi:hypothetical protein
LDRGQLGPVEENTEALGALGEAQAIPADSDQSLRAAAGTGEDGLATGRELSLKWVRLAGASLAVSKGGHQLGRVTPEPLAELAPIDRDPAVVDGGHSGAAVTALQGGAHPEWYLRLLPAV